MLGLQDARQSIVAIASAVAPALRGSVRMSGEDCLEVLQRCTAEPLCKPTRPVRCPLTLQLEELGQWNVDALIWPGNQSYTGAPTVEIHTDGALPLLEAIVATLVSAGARPAGPGEFTMRAFLAGRLDLTQAEAVLGVIDARSQAQLDHALAQLAGNLALPLKQVRRDLLDLLADIEAGLDFVDEDIQFISDSAIGERLSQAISHVRDASQNLVVRRRSEAFVTAVLRGEPNAGKSSLLNALCDEQAAIVSDIAGTTRDTIWRDSRIGDQSIRLMDTAGIEAAMDELQSAGQKMAEHSAKHADLVLYCTPAQRLVHQAQADQSAGELRIATMCDQVDESALATLRRWGWITTSAVRGDGLDELRAAIEESACRVQSLDGTSVPGTAARCADAIQRVVDCLQTAREFLSRQIGHEYLADQIRQALDALGEVTGELYTDDILDRVFSRFCIGK